MLDQEHRDAQLAVDPADELSELDLLGGIGACGRLVQQQHLGARAEGPRDLQAPAVSVGKRARDLVRPFAQPDELQELEGLEVALVLLAPRPRQALSMAPIGPVCCLDSTPIFTFSNVVSALNMREVWKVLATPSRLTL